MTFKITYQYESGAFEYEYKEFDDWFGAEDYAKKQAVERSAKDFWVI